MSTYLPQALKLHAFLADQHWNGHALAGPDPGVRLNYRLGRFVKSYLRFLNWKDDLCYQPAQSYWTLGNWVLYALTGDSEYRQIAVRCSEYALARQRPDGAWDYPNPEWKGRVATVEGTWAAIGLLKTYQHTGEPQFLAGVTSWHRYLIHEIGFQKVGDELAVNYFAHRGDVRVPNNSTTLLSFLAELANTTDDTSYLEPCAGLLNFVRRAQMPTGEIPYSMGGPSDPSFYRPHFQCYQYNAFECLSLIRYYELTSDTAVLPIITLQLEFLRDGLAGDGHAGYDCDNRSRAVTYHAAALAAAFTKAGQIGLQGYESLAARAYGYVLSLQDSRGGFLHSKRDYGLLSDQRAYPRYLAMILYHLLLPGLATEKATGRAHSSMTRGSR